VVLVCLSALISVGAVTGSVTAQPSPIDEKRSLLEEDYNSGWAFYLDNDAFSLLDIDQDYTGGFAVTLSGHRAEDYFFSLDPLLRGLTWLTGVGHLYGRHGSFELHSIELGLTSFTPEEIATAEPIYDDHPYASLVFMANSEQRVVPDENVACQSMLTVGVLGTRIAEGIQTGIHRALGHQIPKGWRNQISDGGELTAKYSVAIQKTYVKDDGRRFLGYDFKTGVEANAGYTTDASLGVSGRAGRIRTPWWSFNPHQAEYVNLGSPVISESPDARSDEFYLWFGGSVRYRVYNAILQGQFRDSAVEFSRSDLNPWIGEAWVGLTAQMSKRFRLSVFIRARSKELKVVERRNPIWGGIILSMAHVSRPEGY
jgi:hypothetical protein